MNFLELLSGLRIHTSRPFSDANRSAFEVDFDRIIFSHPFRSLQNKTQVVPMPDHDFVHTRLTHSLEVSSVGRSLGRQAGQYICKQFPEIEEQGITVFEIGSIVAAACLAHDLGNPPFGHAGEAAISNFFRKLDLSEFSLKEKEDLLHFEGNAQGFRLLVTRKDLHPTLATLGAFTKYPCASIFPGKDKSRKSQKKFGFFQSEKQDFESVADTLGMLRSGEAWVRHPLSFLVEAADDLCYLLIDMEDAVATRKIHIRDFEALMVNVLQSDMPGGESYQARPIIEKAGLLRAMGISRLVQSCVQAFEENFVAIMAGNFETALTDCIPEASALKEISRFSAEEIYNSPDVLALQAAGFEVLPELTGMFLFAMDDCAENGRKASAQHKNLCRLLPFPLGEIEKMDNRYLRIRWLLDFISGLSDRNAMDMYARIKGIRLR